MFFSPISNYHLSSSQIDVWCFSLEKSSSLAYALLSKEEQQTANRFIFPHHTRRYITAHATMRRLISYYLNQTATSLQFNFNSYGKPSVESHCALEFNLTHSHDMALLAVGQSFPLGVDLEVFSSRPYETIAQELFSKEEVTLFKTLPNSLRQLAFFHIWTQKEALVKACGIGLNYPTQSFSVPITPPTDSLIRDDVNKRFWKIKSFMPKPSLSAALCYEPSIETIRYQVIDPEHLLTQEPHLCLYENEAESLNF